MNTIQREAVAAGFIEALSNAEVLAAWQAANADSAALRNLIRTTLGLAQTPSEDDLAAMQAFADKMLADGGGRLTIPLPDGPNIVGMGFSVQPKS